eukprot:s18_g15.t1
MESCCIVKDVTPMVEAAAEPILVLEDPVTRLEFDAAIRRLEKRMEQLEMQLRSVPETTVPETVVLDNAETHDLKICGAILGNEVPASDAAGEDACWAEHWICRTGSDAILVDQEGESEEEIANADNTRHSPGPAAAAAAAAEALRHACLCRLAKQNLPNVHILATKCPAVDPAQGSATIFSLDVRERSMTEHALHGYLARDVALSGHYCIKRYFGEYFWKKLRPHEQKMIALHIGGFRCALDNAIWRHYLKVAPPTGDTWRSFCSQKPNAEDEEQA